ncbi:MAG TPA: M48 family metalloprotease [Isosphaeraceae bacterium]|jgi:predicted Zn-dependent protease
MSYGSDRGPGRGVNLRWVLALIVAAIGVIGYMARTEINPVTGEKQHIAMSVDQEMALGLQAAPRMAREMGGEIDPDRDPRARLVEEVGRRLVQASNAGRSPYVENFHFYLLDDPRTINAFALPGGQIFITRALFEKLETEAELAGVLGHEIGHVINRHAAEHMATGQLGQMLATAVGVGASDERGHGRTAAMAAMMANQMLQLKYGRDDESESDRYGLEAMAQAGYDPTGMLDVMRVLKEASQGNRPPEFLSSHPLPETRLQEIEAQIRAAYPDGIPRDLTQGRSLSGAGPSRPAG